MAEKKQDEATPDAGAPKASGARYRVLSGGISTPSGTHYRGDVLTAEEIGDPARIATLLERGSLEVARD